MKQVRNRSGSLFKVKLLDGSLAVYSEYSTTYDKNFHTKPDIYSIQKRHMLGRELDKKIERSIVVEVEKPKVVKCITELSSRVAECPIGTYHILY